MKAMIISGSRNPAGQTARAAQALAEGLSAGGAQSQTVYLPEKKIERCRQCDQAGWGACIKEGHCVIEDDLAGLLDQLREADLAVFATPVYYSDLSESLRAFLDRVRRIMRHDAGKKGLVGKRAVGICVAGGGGGGAPACTGSLDRTLSSSGFDVVDVLPVRRQNLEMKREVLKVMGKWLAGTAVQV
jgi:multimeric flavodoxin WrbA